MKSHLRVSLGIIAAVVICCLWAGCAAGPVADWNSRVGSYTYDQAVKELGKPPMTMKQNDGTMVAEWMTRRDERRSTLGLGTGVSSAGSGAGLAQPLESLPHDQYLQLTFDKDGKLTAWKNVTK